MRSRRKPKPRPTSRRTNRRAMVPPDVSREKPSGPSRRPPQFRPDGQVQARARKLPASQTQSKSQAARQNKEYARSEFRRRERASLVRRQAKSVQFGLRSEFFAYQIDRPQNPRTW